MTGRFQWRWFLISIVLTAVLAVMAWRLLLDTKEGEPLLRPVIEAGVIVPARETLPAVRVVPGVVASVFDATLAGKISGLVEKIRVQEGDRVGAGDALIVLDSRDVRARLAQARAERDNAEARYRRLQQLFEEGLAASQELENAERAYKVAEANTNAVEADLTYTVIAAPFEGVIAEKMVEVGELATPGRPLLRLEDDRHLRLEVTVAESDLTALEPGREVVVRLGAFGGEAMPARIAEILPVADPSTHSVTVKAELPWRAGLKSGLFGEMDLPVGSISVLTIPVAAIRQRADLALVYAVDDSGIVQSRLIKVGKLHGERAEVLSGLNEGERIIDRARDGLDGARIVPPAGAP